MAPQPANTAAAVAASRKKKRRRLITALIILAAVAAGLVIAGMSFGLIGKADIEVPDFKGKTIEEAEELAEEHGLKVDVSDYKKSDEYKAGEIMDQDPPAGEKVRKNTTISLTVSKGSDESIVPNVVGLSEKDATDILEKAGYKVKVKEVTEPQTKGIVVNQDPPAGEKVKNGTEVTIEVSNGEGKEEGTVPNLIGLTADEAKQSIRDAGFEVGTISEETNSEYKEGKVIDQQYDAGTTLEKGTSISFTISKGVASTTVQL